MPHSFGSVGPFLIALTCAALLAASTSGRADTVTIYRDTWGVPHIYGRSERAVAFAFGYAQAEDRLEAVTKGTARLIECTHCIQSHSRQTALRRTPLERAAGNCKAVLGRSPGYDPTPAFPAFSSPPAGLSPSGVEPSR